jgi:exonuclease SbcC
MKPLSLRLRGFTGIQKGLGLDELTLDLSPVSGLIALVGENGGGKTTVLENLSPYRTLFSRDGSLNSHVCLRNAEKEFAFSYEGHIYRTLLKIDAESDRGEGFIWKDDVPVVDGKRKSYDAYIENLLGSQNLFQNSVFCAQNSKKITDMRTGELRELFAEFLRLDKLTAYEATTKQCIMLISGQEITLRNRLAVLKGQMIKKDGLFFQIGIARTNIAAFGRDQLEQEQSIDKLKSDCESLKDTISQNTANAARKADIQEVIASIEKEIAEIKAQAEKELSELRRQYAEAEKGGRKYAEVLTKKEQAEGAAEREKAVNQELVELGERGEYLRVEYEPLLKDVNGQIVLISNERLVIRDLENDPELAQLDKGIASLKADCLHCEDKIKDLNKRDPKCQSTTCSFIIGALAAKEKLTVGREKLTEWETKHGTISAARGNDIREREAELEKLTASVSGKERRLRDIALSVATIRETKTARNVELQTLASLIALLPEIQIAQARQDDTKKLMEELLVKGADAKRAWGEKECLKLEQVQEHLKRLEIVNAMIDPGAEIRLKSFQKSIAEHETLVATLSKSITEQSEKIIGLSKEISMLAEVEKEIEQAEKEVARLNIEASEWMYLRNACSKTGLQALEIDGVVPLIVFDSNRLLSQTFGPTFSVRIETQDEDGKEVFRVLVIREDGSETLVDNLSGGQAIWILKALRLSMTLLSKRKSGRNFDCVFSDEIDGGLDVENAKTFISMYRAFMKEGNFESSFFISHKPECLSLADHVLKFQEGGITID